MNKDKSKKIKFLIFLFVVFFVMIVAKYFHLEEYFDVSFLKNKILEFGVFAPVFYIFLYIFATIFFLPGSTLTIAGGALFGSFWGTVYAVLGATIGAVIAFLFARYFAESFVEGFLKDRFEKLIEYDKKIKQNGFLVVLFLRLIPIFPFNGLNFGLGLTMVGLKDYFWGTFLGIIPGTFVFAYFGSSLASMDFQNMFFATLILILFLLISPIYNKFKKKNDNEFDIIVIGAGAGGLNIAVFMNKAGFKTLLIDKKDEAIGGDCLNFGCIPSKSLIYVSSLIKESKKSEKFGINVSGSVDFKMIKRYIEEKKSIIRKHENKAYFEKTGITVALGYAEFVSKNEVKVKNKIYKAKKIVLATGSKAKRLDIENSDKVDILTNEDIFNIDKIPERLLVIGGGQMGIEIGQAFLNLGSRVSIVQKSDRILPKEDKEISDLLFKKLKKDGMSFYLNSYPKKFISKNQLLIINKAKEEKIIKFDAVFVAVGREVNIKGLGLDKAGILADERGIIADKYLRTTNKNVYLCGDVAGQYQFTHMAELHASVILRNFFSPIKKRVNMDNISWVTYTNPEIATFGLSEKEIKKRRIKYKVLKSKLKDDDRAIVSDATDGMIKIFVSKKGKLLGGSIIAKNAGEIFQELILVKSSGLKIKNIFNKIYPYPTATRINKKVASKFFSEKLTKLNKRILRFFY